jgi:hypothetical protein
MARHSGILMWLQVTISVVLPVDRGSGQHHPRAGDHRPGGQQPQVHQRRRDDALYHREAVK